MGEQYESRTSRRGSGSPALLIILLLLLLINTLGMGYLAYQTYLSNTGKNTFDEQIARLEKEIDKINAASVTTTTSSTVTSSAANDTKPADSSQTAQGETPASSSLPQTGGETTADSVTQEAGQTQAASESVDTEATTYVVQPGDALSLIAEQYGLSLEEIMLKNGMVDTTVIVGDVLTVR